MHKRKEKEDFLHFYFFFLHERTFTFSYSIIVFLHFNGIWNFFCMYFLFFSFWVFCVDWKRKASGEHFFPVDLDVVVVVVDEDDGTAGVVNVSMIVSLFSAWPSPCVVLLGQQRMRLVNISFLWKVRVFFKSKHVLEIN